MIILSFRNNIMQSYLTYAHKASVNSATPIIKLNILEKEYIPKRPKTPERT